MIGRNLAISNSFYLQFSNATSADYTINLFNLGNGNGTLTPFRYGTLSSAFSGSVINLVSSVFNANGIIDIYDINNVQISSQPVSLGSSLASYLLAINNLIDSQGNVGTLFIQPTPNGANTDYDFACTGIALSYIEFNFSTTYQVNFVVQTINYVLTNPFITALSTTPIDEITQSQIGYAYRVLTMDFYSTNQDQILQRITHGSKDANGNDYDMIIAPTIDPYQDVGISIHGEPTINFVIDASTTFSYVVLAGATVRLTFNYIPISVSDLREYETALNQRILMEYQKEQNILNLSRNNVHILLQ